MDFLKLAEKRRSVHDFKKKQVPENDLYYVLESARWAPSAGNSQPWRFIVVRDEAIKKKLAYPCYNQKWMADAPVLIVVCSNKESERQFPNNGKLLADHSIGAAIQNMLLAAESKGLSTCWVAVSSEARIKNIFEIQDDIEIQAVVALGYARRKTYAPAPRLDSHALTHWDAWDTKETDLAMYKTGDVTKPLMERKKVKKLKEKLRFRRKR
jgi:nitroreductase